jgi:hypothetical protein
MAFSLSFLFFLFLLNFIIHLCPYSTFSPSRSFTYFSIYSQPQLTSPLSILLILSTISFFYYQLAPGTNGKLQKYVLFLLSIENEKKMFLLFVAVIFWLFDFNGFCPWEEWVSRYLYFVPRKLGGTEWSTVVSEQ